MGDTGTSVTLIFYRINASDWFKEPALNLLAAAAQMSSYTHVELAIGEVAGQNGMMANVARIYNDNIGVEICERTGRNPQYTYLALGCSRAAESRMLAFARQQVGKPFSNVGMARSLLWPRSTDNKSFYCAELVAAILKQGGLLSQESNPGAATPHSLYKLYSKQAAATANPFVLRQAASRLSLNSVVSSRPCLMPAGPSNSMTAPLLGGGGVAASPTATLAKSHGLGGSARRHSDSPPRASFKLLAAPRTAVPQKGLTISLNSLR